MATQPLEKRSKYETTVLYVVQSLIVVAAVAGVGSGLNSRLNSAAIDSLWASVNSMQQSLHELAKTQQETALINATQTQQLVFMNDELKECKRSLRESRRQ